MSNIYAINYHNVIDWNIIDSNHLHFISFCKFVSNSNINIYVNHCDHFFFNSYIHREINKKIDIQN